jgi:hypothetical protein
VGKCEKSDEVVLRIKKRRYSYFYQKLILKHDRFLLLLLKTLTVVSVVLPAHKEDERGSEDQRVNKMRQRKKRWTVNES